MLAAAAFVVKQQSEDDLYLEEIPLLGVAGTRLSQDIQQDVLAGDLANTLAELKGLSGTYRLAEIKDSRTEFVESQANFYNLVKRNRKIPSYTIELQNTVDVISPFIVKLQSPAPQGVGLKTQKVGKTIVYKCCTGAQLQQWLSSNLTREITGAMNLRGLPQDAGAGAAQWLLDRCIIYDIQKSQMEVESKRCTFDPAVAYRFQPITRDAIKKGPIVLLWDKATMRNKRRCDRVLVLNNKTLGCFKGDRSHPKEAMVLYDDTPNAFEVKEIELDDTGHFAFQVSYLPNPQQQMQFQVQNRQEMLEWMAAISQAIKARTDDSRASATVRVLVDRKLPLDFGIESSMNVYRLISAITGHPTVPKGGRYALYERLFDSDWKIDGGTLVKDITVVKDRTLDIKANYLHYSDLDTMFLNLRPRLSDPKVGIPVDDLPDPKRKYCTYPMCFTGSMAVDWATENADDEMVVLLNLHDIEYLSEPIKTGGLFDARQQVISRLDGLKICQQLARHRLIIPAGSQDWKVVDLKDDDKLWRVVPDMKAMQYAKVDVEDRSAAMKKDIKRRVAVLTAGCLCLLSKETDCVPAYVLPLSNVEARISSDDSTQAAAQSLPMIEFCAVGDPKAKKAAPKETILRMRLVRSKDTDRWMQIFEKMKDGDVSSGEGWGGLGGGSPSTTPAISQANSRIVSRRQSRQGSVDGSVDEESSSLPEKMQPVLQTKQQSSQSLLGSPISGGDSKSFIADNSTPKLSPKPPPTAAAAATMTTATIKSTKKEAGAPLLGASSAKVANYGATFSNGVRPWDMHPDDVSGCGCFPCVYLWRRSNRKKQWKRQHLDI